MKIKLENKYKTCCLDSDTSEQEEMAVSTTITVIL